MKTTLIIPFLILSVTVCNAQSKATKKPKAFTVPENLSDKSYQPLNFAIVIAKVDTRNCLVIDTVCAVEIMPDAKWIKQQQHKTPEDEWYTIADDNLYYLSLATDTLKKLKIDVLNYTRKESFIKFIKPDNSEIVIDSKKMMDAWGLILFNGKDNPVFWKGTDIYDGLKDIYNK